jgi:flagellar assembly factor FliW
MTINLQAPVVINKRKNIGAQIVLMDGKYHTKHNVLAEMQASAYYAQQANA